MNCHQTQLCDFRLVETGCFEVEEDKSADLCGTTFKDWWVFKSGVFVVGVVVGFRSGLRSVGVFGWGEFTSGGSEGGSGGDWGGHSGILMKILV